MSARDGGTAFPLPLGTANCAEPEQSGGMTLRDYFAAQALPQVIASILRPSGSPALIAQRSYEIADAMLAERAE